MKPTLAWEVIRRTAVYGAGLGVVSGAIYGPVSMLILYAVEIFNGRYGLPSFPFANAAVVCMAAFVGGTLFGGIFGSFAGLISGIILTLGILLSASRLSSSKLYRNTFIALCAACSGFMVLLPLSNAILGGGWFFNGEGVIAPLFSLAILPATISAIATWWADMRVVKWWMKAGNTSYKQAGDERLEEITI